MEVKIVDRFMQEALVFTIAASLFATVAGAWHDYPMFSYIGIVVWIFAVNAAQNKMKKVESGY